jgi:hypothetical protein
MLMDGVETVEVAWSAAPQSTRGTPDAGSTIEFEDVSSGELL